MSYYHKFPSLFRAQGGTPPFSPTDVSGLNRWYDPSDAATISQTAGSVNAIADKSGGGRNATQGTGTQQPTIGSGTINGLAALNFNSALMQFMSFAALPTTCTVFAIVEMGTSTGVVGLTIVGGSSSGHLPVAQSGSQTTSVYLNCGSPTMRVNGVAKSPATRNLMYDDLRNGGADTIISFRNVTGTNLNQLGRAPSNFFMSGLMGEFLVYDRNLTDAEMNLIGDYLDNKWGPTWTPIV